MILQTHSGILQYCIIRFFFLICVGAGYCGRGTEGIRTREHVAIEQDGISIEYFMKFGDNVRLREGPRRVFKMFYCDIKKSGFSLS